MDSVDVVNTLIDIILDEVTRNKMAHMVEDANITFGRICNINAIYNIFPDGDSNPNPQNSSQADKYLPNMALTDPTDPMFGMVWLGQVVILGHGSTQESFQLVQNS